MCQNSIEVELDKRGGKNFGPPGGKKMTIFMDDLSMPEVKLDGNDGQTSVFEHETVSVSFTRVLGGANVARNGGLG